MQYSLPFLLPHSSDIKDVVSPALGLELLDTLRSTRRLLVPDLDNTAGCVDVLEDALARLCNTNTGVKIWVILRRETSGHSLEEGEYIVWIRDASCTEAFAGVEDFTVGGMEEISQTRSLRSCVLAMWLLYDQ